MCIRGGGPIIVISYCRWIVIFSFISQWKVLKFWYIESCYLKFDISKFDWSIFDGSKMDGSKFDGSKFDRSKFLKRVSKPSKMVTFC